jgi:hypothetical protein
VVVDLDVNLPHVIPQRVTLPEHRVGYSITKNGFAQRCVIEDNNDGTQCYVDMDVFRRLAFYKTPHLPFETDIDEELRRLRNASA